MLRFDSNKYDFWEISKSIQHFYPIGISTDDESYFLYPGIKELEKIVVDNIHNESDLKSRWTALSKEIEDEIQKPVIGTTYGQTPSFSSFIQLETSSMDNLTRTKELHFYLSLIGPFYTIIAQDNNIVKVGKGGYFSTNYLVISPEEEYAEAFKLVADKIENRFPGYRFVPFGISHQKIEGLYTRHTIVGPDTVFNALFGGTARLTSATIGDWAYGYDNWISADFNGIERVVILEPPPKQ